MEAGHEVIALRRPGGVPRIPLVIQPTWVEGRLDDDWTEILRSCDALVHLAAHGVSPQPTDWNQSIDVNVRQSTLLSIRALEAGVAQIIACGSCLEFGRTGERFDFIPASAPLEPMGPYATSKALFALALGALARSSDASIQLLRPFHLYGEGQNQLNFWPSLRKAALAGEDYPMTLGEQIRDFQEVGSAAAAFVGALGTGNSNSGTLLTRNIGSGKAVTVREFAARCWLEWAAKGRLLCGDVPYRENEIMRFVPEV